MTSEEELIFLSRSPVRRRVVGLTVVIEEYVKKERKTKNILTQTIVRKTLKAIELDCGHKIPFKNFHKIPTNNTNCYECPAAEEGAKDE